MKLANTLWGCVYCRYIMMCWQWTIVLPHVPIVFIRSLDQMMNDETRLDLYLKKVFKSRHRISPHSVCSLLPSSKLIFAHNTPRSHYAITLTNPTAIMPRIKSCIICSAVASPDLQLQYCDACQSALYCSKAYQRIDWKKKHTQTCKLLNAGH
jgi:hypothetical protein